MPPQVTRPTPQRWSTSTFLLLFLLGAAVFAPIEAEVALDACKNSYTIAAGGAASASEKCRALNNLIVCISDGKATDAVASEYDDFVSIETNAQPDCDATGLSAAQMSEEFGKAGSMRFAAPFGGDFSFKRGQRDTVSVAQIDADVTSLKTNSARKANITAALESAKAAAKAKIDQFRTTLNSLVKKSVQEQAAQMIAASAPAVTQAQEAVASLSGKAGLTYVNGKLDAYKQNRDDNFKTRLQVAEDRIKILEQIVVKINQTDQRLFALESQCGSHEYQVGAAIYASATLPDCRIVSVCAANEWERARPTSTSDRECAKFTSCMETQYEMTPATPTADRTCGDLTRCKAPLEGGRYIQYETAAPTRTSNRVCMDATVCKLPLVETVAATATSDRQCTALAALGLSSLSPAPSCKHVLTETPDAVSGAYWIQYSRRSKPIQAYCDMDVTFQGQKGGWTLCGKLDKTRAGSQFLTQGFARGDNAASDMQDILTFTQANTRWSSIDCRGLIEDGAEYWLHVGDDNGVAPYDRYRFTNIPGDVKANKGVQLFNINRDDVGTCTQNVVFTFDESGANLGTNDNGNNLAGRQCLAGDGHGFCSNKRDGQRFSNAGNGGGNGGCSGSGGDTIYWAWNEDDHGCGTNVIGTGCFNTGEPTYRYNLLYFR